MTKLLVAALLAFSCAMDPNKDPRAIPLSTQAELAGIILIGTMAEPYFHSDGSQGIKLVNVKYCTGDGPSIVNVRGFGALNNYVLALPVVGTEVVIFGCQSKDAFYPVALNDFYSAAGIRTYIDEVKSFIDANYTPRPGRGTFKFGRCRTTPSVISPSPNRFF